MNDRERFEAWLKEDTTIELDDELTDFAWYVWKAATAEVKENMKDRKKFEKHTKQVLGLCIDIGVDGEYESDRTRENWLTWQAATAESAARIAKLENALEYLIDTCPPIDPCGEEAHQRAKAITNTGDKT